MNDTAERITGSVARVAITGSLSGLAGVCICRFIGQAGIPSNVTVLAAVCFFVTALGLGSGGKWYLPVTGAVIAGITMMLPVLLFNVPVIREISSVTVLLICGMFLSLLWLVAGKDASVSTLSRAMLAGSTALLSSIAFFYAGLNLVPSEYLLGYSRPGGILAYLRVEGLSWAVSSAILFPAGWFAGSRIEKSYTIFSHAHPNIAIISAVITVLLLWAASIAAVLLPGLP